MNEFVYKLTLDLNCAKTPPIICSGQFDKGRKFEFTITANGEPYDVTGCSAVLKGVRTNGSHFAVECTVSGGKITKTLDDTTLSVRGKTVAKLVVSDSTKSYSTQMFIIDVDSSLDGNITVTDDYSILNRLIEQIHALNESGAIIIDDTINNNSNNAVANKAVAIALAQKSDKSATYTKTELDTALVTKADKATTLAGYGITDGENIGNKVTDKSKITDEDANYPSIGYLNDYYYDYSEVDDALSGKLDNTAGSVKTDNIANGAITVDKMAVCVDKSVKNMFGNMGIKFGRIDSTGTVTIDDESVHLLVYTKLEPNTKYYFAKNNNGNAEKFAPLSVFLYDINDNFISKIYNWNSYFTTPDNISYCIFPLGSKKTSSRDYNYMPYQISDKEITQIYPINYTETIYADDVATEKELIEYIAGEHVKSGVDYVKNYFIPNKEIIIPVKTGEKITHNLWSFVVLFYCDESGIINAGYSNLSQNTTVGVKPQATTFTIPDGVKSIKINANNGTYPNSAQNYWFKINNPQIVKGDKLYDDLKSGDNCILEETFENKIKNNSNAEALSLMLSNGVISPMYGKKWMIFGDSTSCYADKNYPDYIAEKTNCIISNKAAAGSRITANEGSGNPIVNIVENSLTSDMEILTLLGGYNDRRSYDSSNPDWTWLGDMFNSDGSINTDKTTFYGALNTIAQKWFEVCPSAIKIFFTILPCHTNPNGKYETKINSIIKEVANYWSIPCFDAWNEVGLPVRLDYINNTYYMGDRIHPNDAGNEIIARYIQAKIESVLR